MRCGKYVSRACTLDLAPVQVRDTFGVLLNRASLEVTSVSIKGAWQASFEPINAVSLAWKCGPGCGASSASVSGLFSTLWTVGKRKDAGEALELASQVLRADDSPAASVPERTGIITARTGQKTTPTSGWVLPVMLPPAIKGK